jgi:hypothetical protein
VASAIFVDGMLIIGGDDGVLMAVAPDATPIEDAEAGIPAVAR